MIHKNITQSNDMDFDEIMRTSVSADVRSKYRESVGMGRLSIVPRTADMSLRTSFGSKTSSGDFWDAAKISTNSFGTQNMSVVSDDFRPAEEMTEKLREDQRQQEQEFATMPVAQQVSNSVHWEERASRQPEISFGAYCQDFLPNIRDLYNNKSPEKRKNRVAMVDLTNDDETQDSDSSHIGMTHIRKLLSKLSMTSGKF